MSIESNFSITNRDLKHEQPRVSLLERRAAKTDACNQNEVHGENPGLSQVPSHVSPELPMGPTPLSVLLGARLLGASLDRHLADGRAPESSRLLAARAQLLTSPTKRRRLAEHWLALLAEAREPVTLIDPRVPVVGERIIAARTQIHELVDALLAPMPTSRGVAMANTLLSDGSGPIFNRNCPADLASTLREVVARLDPLVS
jgi:hypothetical protein